MRNTNKYTKLYSGGTPIFLEDDIFEIMIPMDSVANLKVGPEVNEKVNEKVNERADEKANKKEKINEKVNEKVNKKVNEIEKNVLALLIENLEYTVTQLAEILEVSRKTVASRLKRLKEKGVIERIGSLRKGYWKIKIITAGKQ